MDFAIWQNAPATVVKIESGQLGVASPATVPVMPVYIAGTPEGITEEQVFQRLFINGLKLAENTQGAFRSEWPPEILESFTFKSDTIQWSELKE